MILVPLTALTLTAGMWTGPSYVAKAELCKQIISIQKNSVPLR